MTLAAAPHATPLPEGEAATGPPESRGVDRDAVRLLVARPDGVDHTVFRHLGEHLRGGDVVVVNTSATRPAAIAGRWRGRSVVVHLASDLGGGNWLVELRQSDGSGPILDAGPGDTIDIDGGGVVTLTEGLTRERGTRLWRSVVATTSSVRAHMEEYGRPITYGYSPTRWPLDRYQTVFAREDDPTGASAEMPSAGRPFTPELVTRLVVDGITVAPVTLHTGVSSQERGEMPHPEWFSVGRRTAGIVNMARRSGGRIVAVGTTVTRALESAAAAHGDIAPAEGWTGLVLGPDRPTRVVTGLVTGWHPPDASHLLLLEAVAGKGLVSDAYHAALAAGYLWHEFGDACVLLP